MIHHATPPPGELTVRQAEVLRTIHSHLVEEDCYPTIRELMAYFGIRSPNGIMCHLLALRKKGLIRWRPFTSRSIRLTGLRLVYEYTPDEAGQRLRKELEEE